MRILKSTLGLVMIFLFVASLFTFCCGLSHAQMTGREIMEKQRELHKSHDEEETLKMELIDKKGRVKEREIIRYSLALPNDLNKFVIKFLKPRDVEGTGLLTWENKDRDDDQWLYLPAMRKEKRIAKSGMKNEFMGTDFTYGDLRPEDLDAHDYNVIASETIDGHECYVIEALPKTEERKRESGYSKRKLWVRKDILYTVKIEFYDERGKLLKVETDEGLKNVKDTMWRSEKITMHNVKKKHKTVLTSKERKIDQGVSEDIFTVKWLKRS